VPVEASAEAMEPSSRSVARGGDEAAAGVAPSGSVERWFRSACGCVYSIAAVKDKASRSGAQRYRQGRGGGFATYTVGREATTMPREIDWTDTLEIGIQLQEMFPDTDPYSVRFTDLHKWVTQLPGFVGDPAKSNEGLLEAIQMAWHEEYIDAKDA
jgi:FeS assembly protein IscX